VLVEGECDLQDNKEGKAKRKKLHNGWVARMEEEENRFIGRKVRKNSNRQHARFHTSSPVFGFLHLS